MGVQRAEIVTHDGPLQFRVPQLISVKTGTSGTAPRRRTSSGRHGGRTAEVGMMLAGDTMLLLPLLLIFDPILVAVTAAVALTTLRMKGLYRHRIALSVLDDVPALSAAVLIGIAPGALLAPIVLTEGPTTILLTAVAMFIAMSVGRAVSYAAILRNRGSGRISYPTLILGAGSAATALTRRIQAHPESGLRLVGALTDQEGRSPASVPLLGGSNDLAKVVRREGITDVVIGYGGMSSAALVDVLRACDRADVEIYIVPRLFELHALRGADDHIWGLPLVRIRRPAQRVLTWRLKRAFDVAVAAVIMLVLAPVFAAVAAAVRLELGPGVFFRQTRIGLNGEPFELLKFRSMPAAPPDAARGWTVPRSQIGKVGAFIRRYSLDELPQVLNVLRGDMSLVGPRPERPEYVEQFCAVIPRYRDRHRLPSGMTGLAAVNGLRGDTSIEDRAQFDNWYIDSWSLWLDVKIMLRTLVSVLRGTGA